MKTGTNEQIEKLAQITANGFDEAREDRKKIREDIADLDKKLSQRINGLENRIDEHSSNKTDKDEQYKLKQQVESIDQRVTVLETATV